MADIQVVHRPHAAPPSPVRRGRRRRRAWPVLALLPFVAFVVVFAAYPLFELIRLAFSAVSIRGGIFEFSLTGLDNFAKAVSDPLAQSSLGLTALFIVCTVAISVTLGVVMALVVDRVVYVRAVARNVLIWPAVVTPVVVSVIWLLVLSPTAGGLNKVLESLGLPGQSWLNSPAGAFMSIIAVDVWHWTPIVFLFVYTAIQGLSADLLAAARVDGATEWQIRWRVVLPLLRPAIAGVALIRVIQGVKAFDEVYLLTQGGPDGATSLISLYIRTEFFDRLQYGYASALAVTTVGAVVVIALIALMARRRISRKAR